MEKQIGRKVREGTKSHIRLWEGFHATPYLSSHARWAIGYGHTRTVRAGQHITMVEAETLLTDDLRLVERAVTRLVEVELSDAQFGALVAFCLDVGIMNFERCTLLALLNRGWYDQVPAQLMRWGKTTVPDHPERKRRVAEARLWCSDQIEEKVA